ncbi:pitrilysin family protein [Pelomonas sp. KK5]|uniref:M16 family metallopeptidase n=1 Tax=Pelomonas sp. KK5 TaxID=1855730 RepID=UPI00097C4789|nr:pitrilysin family protein [Pelomonas sp. KK5]
MTHALLSGTVQRRRLLQLGAAAVFASPPAWAQQQQPATKPLAVAPIPLTRRVLPNGLELIAVPQAGYSVSVQVWYRVGGKDDPAGRSGFAHLFEHMMFKRTRYMADEQFDRMTEDVGGSNNAFTADDMTAFHSVVPANHLEPLLWAEAERMSNLQVDQGNFDSEREVVKEEYRQRVLAEPYGKLFNAISGYGYQKHPYRRPVIGSMEDLDAATLRDVQAFHDTYYRPDNAVLIVAGAFDPLQLDRWVDHYFGSIRQPREPVPRVNVPEPRRSTDALFTLTGPNVPLPAVLLIWQAPKAASPDAPALQVAQGLLSLGDSSRLNESLVYRMQIAQSAGFDAMLNADAGLLVANAIAAGEQKAQDLVEPLAREVQRLAEEPIAPAELDKVKAQLLTAALVKRQTPLGLGEAVGQAALLRGDAGWVNRDLAALQAVTAADVQRVLRRDVLGAKRVTVLYESEAKS